MIRNMVASSTSRVSERARGLAGRPSRGSDQLARLPPPPPRRDPPPDRAAARRGAALSLRVAGPVPTARRADRLAVDVDVRPDDRVEEDRPDDDDRVEDDRVEDERDEVRADDERADADRDDVARAEDDDADRDDDGFADVFRVAADEREDDVRAERVVDRAGERPDPFARVPPPPEDVRPDPLREVTAWPRCTA